MKQKFSTAYAQLEGIFEEYYYLKSIYSLLQWDQATYMPVAAYKLRAKQLFVMQSAMQQLFNTDSLQKLIESAFSKISALNAIQQANLHKMLHIWQLKTAIPLTLHKKITQATTKAEIVWRQAKKNNDFLTFQPEFSEVIKLTIEKAHYLAEVLQVSLYDALLQEYDPGNGTKNFEPIFTQLENQLPPLVQQIIDFQKGSIGSYPAIKMHKELQHVICAQVATDLGFDLKRGRLDTSAHPFTEGVRNDIRITTHYKTNNFMYGLLATSHECGHALYDANLPKELYTQPVGYDLGMLVHEASALFYENCITRNPAFARYLAKLCQQKQANVSEQQIAANLFKIEPTLIRLESDEVTYIPHIILRYRIEKQLIEGVIKVDDIPVLWHDYCLKLLGSAPINQQQGCLQDIHWALGSFGYFPSYAQGAMLSSNLYGYCFKNHLTQVEIFTKTEFENILHTLVQYVFTHGSRKPLLDYLNALPFDAFSSDNYLTYLRDKYLTHNRM
ncbi:MAG: carboxypeptidase M32 [Gammaproteobacteria bacterium]